MNRIIVSCATLLVVSIFDGRLNALKQLPSSESTSAPAKPVPTGQPSTNETPQQPALESTASSAGAEAQSKPAAPDQASEAPATRTAIRSDSEPVPSAWVTVLTAAAPTAIWALLIWGVLFVYRHEVRGGLQATLGRLRRGASVKLGAVELGAVLAVPSRIEKLEKGRTFRSDDDHRREDERREYYDRSRRVMLVHRLLPSTESGELYDIVIYLIPTYKSTLIGVQRVEYYFGGRGWQHKVFIASDRARAFPVLTAAYGPFLCTAEVFFDDGHVVMLHRFIDFEMGDAVVDTGLPAKEALEPASRN